MSQRGRRCTSTQSLVVPKASQLWLEQQLQRSPELHTAGALSPAKEESAPRKAVPVITDHGKPRSGPPPPYCCQWDSAEVLVSLKSLPLNVKAVVHSFRNSDAQPEGTGGEFVAS